MCSAQAKWVTVAIQRGQELLQAACPISFALAKISPTYPCHGASGQPPGAREAIPFTQLPTTIPKNFQSQTFKKIIFYTRETGWNHKQRKIPRDRTASQTNSLDLGTRTISILYAERKTFYNLTKKLHKQHYPLCWFLFLKGLFWK